MDGTKDGMKEGKEGHKGEGTTVERSNADDEKHERNRRTKEDDKKSQICGNEKKDEHARNTENYDKSSAEDRSDKEEI